MARSRGYGGIRGLIQQQIQQSLAICFQQEMKSLSSAIQTPSVTNSKPGYGDYQSGVAMTLAKPLKLKPLEIASKIKQHLPQSQSNFFDQVVVSPQGFLTFHLSPQYLASRMSKSLLDREKLGLMPPAKMKTVVIDFSSPNIAKEMHVGHLRSTIIGDSLSRLMEFLGHKVIRLNHVGDWGTQFGMLIHYLKSKSIAVNEELSSDELMDYYKQSKISFDASEEFQEQSRLEVYKLQQGDPENIEIWKNICNRSRAEFAKIYQQLDVVIIERGESFYNAMLPRVVRDLETRGVVEAVDGAKAIFFRSEGVPMASSDNADSKDRFPPLVVQKSDGGYLYSTTDLAAIQHRTQVEKADRILYVTDSGQNNHFACVFEAARRGHLTNDSVELIHVPFGVVLGEDGKRIRSRSGDSVKLKDLLTEAIHYAEEDLKKRLVHRDTNNKNEDLSDRALDKANTIGLPSASDRNLTQEEHAIAEKIAVAAIKYADLSMMRTGNYHFSFNKMMKLSGNTAPYMLYAYARISGIHRKAAEKGIGLSDIENSSIVLGLPEELALGKQLSRFEEVLLDVDQDLCPHRLCEFLYDLSQRFNQFYDHCPVLTAESPEILNSRLALCELTARILKRSLWLLGIEIVDWM